MRAFNKSKREKFVGSRYILEYGEIWFLSGWQPHRTNKRFEYEGKKTITERYRKFKNV